MSPDAAAFRASAPIDHDDEYTGTMPLVAYGLDWRLSRTRATWGEIVRVDEAL